MISAVGKLATMGLVGGTVVGTAAAKPKTRNGEHNLNKFQTAVGLSSLVATPYLVKEAVKVNPGLATKVATKTGVVIEKATDYATKYGKKALESNSGKKAISFISTVMDKVKSTKIGQKAMDTISKVAKKIAANKTVQKVATKAAEALQKFAKSSTKQKGIYALAAAGIALLAYAGIKTITNYYKKEGAIDQKYDDLHKKYERMLEIDPITNAKTGEPISFEEYCKLAQTMLK